MAGISTMLSTLFGKKAKKRHSSKRNNKFRPGALHSRFLLMESLEQRCLLSIQPTLSILGDQSAHTGQALNLSELGTFTHDAVSGDFQYQVDWGDGTNFDTGEAKIISQGIEGSDENPLLGSFGSQHIYYDPGEYYAAASVIDPAGDTYTQTFLVTVSGPSIEPPVDNTATTDSTVSSTTTNSTTVTDTTDSASTDISQTTPSVLNVVGDQTAKTGQEINLPEVGVFSHSFVTGDFHYQIDWGDGSDIDTGVATIISADQNSIVGSFGSRHTYYDGGAYYAAATVIDPSGATDTQTFLVTVTGASVERPVDTSSTSDSGTTVQDTSDQASTDSTKTTTDTTVTTTDTAATDQSGTDAAVTTTTDTAVTDTTTTQTQIDVSSQSSQSTSQSAATSDSTLSAQTSSLTTLTLDSAVDAAVRDTLDIPTGISITDEDMARLTSLTIDSNEVQSLSNLSYATNLVTLTIVPSDYSKAGSLTTLAGLSGLTKLKTLTLQDCGITDSVLATLPTLSALQTLDLRYNNITVVPTAVSGQSSLTTLYVYGNPLTDSPHTGLANLAGKLVNIDIPADDPEEVIAAIDPTNPSATYTALAYAFYDMPIEIYEYVVNTIEYQPYQGAMKGALAVLETGAGNEWDTDLLLMQLFAAAGVSTSGLQYYSAEVVETLSNAENMLGVKTALGAIDILYYAGLRPIMLDSSLTAVTDPDSCSYMEFDRVWLEGTLSSQSVVLDPARKFYDYQDGISDIITNVSFDSDGISVKRATDWLMNTMSSRSAIIWRPTIQARRSPTWLIRERSARR